MRIPFCCDALVDQDRFIGEDPIGYKCSSNAVYETTINKKDVLICLGCHTIFKEEPDRITFSNYTGIERQNELIRKIVGRMEKGKFL